MKKVRVILLKDIEKLGKKYDVKEVKMGYAKNFLLPNGLVKVATKKNLKWLGQKVEEKSKKEERELSQFQDLASKIDGLEVVFKVKTNKDNQLFESINEQKISKKLKDMKIDIKKSQIQIQRPIKELGEFSAKIKLPHNLESEIKIIVISETGKSE